MSEAVVKQRASVYTMMLVVSFLCMVGACLFLYFEVSRFNPQADDGTKWPWQIPAKLKAADAEKFAEENLNAAPPADAGTEPAPMPMEPGATPMPMPMEPMPMEPMPMPMEPAAPMPMPAEPATM